MIADVGNGTKTGMNEVESGSGFKKASKYWAGERVAGLTDFKNNDTAQSVLHLCDALHIYCFT